MGPDAAPEHDARVPRWDRPGRHLSVAREVLGQRALEQALRAADRLSGLDRSYIPTHKKGGAISFGRLRDGAPELLGLYRHCFLPWSASLVGLSLAPTPEHDQNACSILVYERPGDHIGWHFDHNFYRGRHFTGLCTLQNRDRAGVGLSSARLIARCEDREIEVPTPPGSFVLFEGARVRHMVTPLGEGERRVVLSMTFCTDPRRSPLQEVARRIKDTAFFGLRALWT